jgi:hypothetical protein
LLERERRIPPGIYRNESDTCSYAKAPPLVQKSEFFHTVTNILGDSQSVIRTAVFENHTELVTT